MVKQSKRELFPPLNRTEVVAQDPSENGSLKFSIEAIWSLGTLAFCFLLLALCLLKASVANYVSILM